MAFIGVRQRIVKLHPTTGNIAQKITHQFESYRLILTREMQHTCNQAGYFVAEVPAEDGRFEANNH
ncbi:MAG: hypothetical protein B7Z21_00160 [Verrucomicrobiales bacterium 32-60-5]|nr:MAG: hypothetical protein B7Z21_00160 [Verrucomicrobiales bacterium 32-60-5]